MSTTAASMEKTYDLCCVGTALIDYVSTADLSVVEELGLALGTMTLVDGATAKKIRAALGQGQLVSGGTVANTAAGVASLGGSPIFVGAVAEDDLGERYASDLEAAGIRSVLELHPLGDEGATGTGACYVISTPDAHRTMATSLGVSGNLHASAVDASAIGSAKLVYFDGYLLDFPDSDEIVERILSLARTYGSRVALGLADPFVVERHGERLRSLITQVDVVFANGDEAMAITDTPTPEAAVRDLRRPGQIVSVTRGDAGATLVSDDGVVTIDAVAVAHVVDTTGAGDLFAAGVAFGLTHGLEVEGAGLLGALCASEVIGHLGARPAIRLATLASRAGLI